MVDFKCSCHNIKVYQTADVCNSSLQIGIKRWEYLPNLLAKKLAITLDCAIVTPSTSSTGTCPNGVSVEQNPRLFMQKIMASNNI